LEQDIKTGENFNIWPCCGIYATKPLKDKDELFYEYGRAHWSFRPNFETLNPKQQKECKNYYAIKPKDIRDVRAKCQGQEK
jgi:hypothetical protein